MTLVSISRKLCAQMNALETQSAAAYTYNPLDYARTAHEAYLKKWGQGKKEVVLLGMNPGPFGMAQTGVPFGDVGFVRDFIGIQTAVGRPAQEHPKRKITGFDCPRSEVSGSRLWGWAQDRFGSPEAFFARFFVINFCPLVFMDEAGRNLTPDKLPIDLRKQIDESCQAAFAQMVEILDPTWVIGVGAFAEKRAKNAVGSSRKVGSILHPSPASPKANRGWAKEAEAELTALGIALPR